MVRFTCRRATAKELTTKVRWRLRNSSNTIILIRLLRQLSSTRWPKLKPEILLSWFIKQPVCLRQQTNYLKMPKEVAMANFHSFVSGGHHGHSQGPLHSHHAPYPMVLLPPGHTQLPPGVSGPSGGPGGPQGVQLLPLGSSAAMGMPIPQIHYIQQAPGNQALQRLGWFCF